MTNTFRITLHGKHVNMFPTLTLARIHGYMRAHINDSKRIHALTTYIQCGIVMVTMHRAYCQTDSLQLVCIILNHTHKHFIQTGHPSIHPSNKLYATRIYTYSSCCFSSDTNFMKSSHIDYGMQIVLICNQI